MNVILAKIFDQVHFDVYLHALYMCLCTQAMHPSYVEQDLALLNTTPCGRVKAHPFIFPSFAQILIGSVDVTHQPITSYSAWRKRENGYCILWVMEVQAHNEHVWISVVQYTTHLVSWCLGSKIFIMNTQLILPQIYIF